MTRIDTSNWREFKLKELFITNKKGGKLQVPTGANVPIKDLQENGNIPRITVTGINNGVIGHFDYIGDKKSDYRVYNNFISVSFLGTVFYQEGDASLDMKVHCLKPIDFTLNQYTGRYLVSVIKSSLQESSYADQISSTVLPEISIQLPVTKENLPDFDYMDSYMRNLEDSVSASLTALQSAQKRKNKNIDVTNWGKFHLYDIFEISMGNKFDRCKMSESNPKYNFVGRSGLNNGVASRIDAVADKNGNYIEPYKAGDITIAMGGSIGSSFIQKEDFYTSQNVCVLHTTNLLINEHVKRFIVTSIMASCSNYEAFVDELNRHIKTDFIIYLPITPDGEPDFKYMENYMKSIYENNVDKHITSLCKCLST